MLRKEAPCAMFFVDMHACGFEVGVKFLLTVPFETYGWLLTDMCLPICSMKSMCCSFFVSCQIALAMKASNPLVKRTGRSLFVWRIDNTPH